MSEQCRHGHWKRDCQLCIYERKYAEGERAATERIVKWLREEAENAEDVDTYNSVQAAAVMRYRADCIERGEHKEATT